MTLEHSPRVSGDLRTLFARPELAAVTELVLHLRWFEVETYSEDWDELLAVSLGPLLDGVLTPKLECLRLTGLRSESVRALQPVLARSPLVPRLRALDLG